jgi:hypothetical protein
MLIVRCRSAAAISAGFGTLSLSALFRTHHQQVRFANDNAAIADIDHRPWMSFDFRMRFIKKLQSQWSAMRLII